jgi:hypothetical protein
VNGEVGGLLHPEWVAGRRLWMDTLMRDLIHKLHYGDPVKGWEGDPNLAVYWNAPEERWEVWRLEDDGEYRIVCRSLPGVVFNDKLIDNLLAWDRRRRSIALHEEIERTNERLDADTARRRDEWASEEVAPRLRHALRREL